MVCLRGEKRFEAFLGIKERLFIVDEFGEELQPAGFMYARVCVCVMHAQALDMNRSTFCIVCVGICVCVYAHVHVFV